MKPAKAGVRERILDAALHLMETSGLTKLAQPQVARAAGVPQGHLTYYFPRRLDLLAGVAGRFVETLRREVTGLVGSPNDPRLRGRVLGFVGRLAKDRARTRTLLGLVVSAEEDETLRAQLADNVVALRGLVASFVGLPEEDPDVDIVLATFWGVGLMHLVLEGRRSDADTDRVLARLDEWLIMRRQARGGSAPAPPEVPAPAEPKVPRRRRPRGT